MDGNQPVALAGLTFYGDASGKDETEGLAVGGFVGTVESWKEFEHEWKAVLDAYGLKYFRMSEFAQSTGQFKGWKDQEQRRIALLDALIGLLKSRALHWFGACVLSSDYDCVDADYQLHEFATKYALCATTLTEIVSTWRENQHRTESLEFVFEEGDLGAGQLSDFVFANTGYRPLFRQKAVCPLQAADFAAYEVRKIYKMVLVETDKLFEKVRKSLERLHEMPCYWGQFREQDLRALCRIHNVPLRKS
jgi:hypothetical protein